jgi:hypothetical protein
MIISAYMLRDLRLVMFKKIIFFKQSLKEFYCNETNMNYLNQNIYKLKILGLCWSSRLSWTDKKGNLNTFLSSEIYVEKYHQGIM